MSLVEQIYELAISVGPLKDCLWCPPDSTTAQRHPAGFAALNNTMFDGLTSTTDYQMSYLALTSLGLIPRDVVEIDGVIYQVHNTRVVGDGSEMHVQPTRMQRRVWQLDP